MKIKRYINSVFLSNTYLLFREEDENIWIVDPGDSRELLDWIKENKKVLKGIFLTHSHIDHIYGINDLCKEFPKTIIYASEFALEGLYCSKANGSYYMDNPYVLNANTVSFVSNKTVIELWDDVLVEAFETPGHNDDCISYCIDNRLFTGDALIPGVKVHLKSKKACRKDALHTINWIKTFFNDETFIFPGHKDECKLKDLITIL